MNIPANVSITKQGAELVLTTPFHSAVVEWCHQNAGRWDKERRAWIVGDSPGQAERFAALVNAIWPDGVATSQGAGKPRWASTRGRAVSTPSSVETCARCKVAPYTGIRLADMPLCAPCVDLVVTAASQYRTPRPEAGQSPAVGPSPVSQEPAKPDRAALRAALSGQ